MIFVPAGRDKSEFIGGISADCYLIDDYNINLTDWQNAGGTAVKFVNDVNDRGLGAYGGEKGQLWSGLRISHEQNAMEICLQIERCARIERTGEKAYSRYGFDGDVLPFDFAGEIIPYFEMRIQMDQDWLQQKAAEGETFESYSVVSGKISTIFCNPNLFGSIWLTGKRIRRLWRVLRNAITTAGSTGSTRSALFPGSPRQSGTIICGARTR